MPPGLNAPPEEGPEGPIRLVLVAGAAMLETGEEGPYRQRAYVPRGSGEPLQPPAVGRQGRGGAPTYLLCQQKALDGFS